MSRKREKTKPLSVPKLCDSLVSGGMLLLVLFTLNVLSASCTRFKHYECAKSNAAGIDGKSLEYNRVRATSGAWAECAASCNSENCIGIAIKTNNSAKRCALISNIQDIPFPTFCSTESAKVEVFMVAEYYPVDANFPCDAILEVRGSNHCLHDAAYSTRYQSEAFAYCRNLGGQLPEAESLLDFAVIRSVLPREEDEGATWVWMNATSTEGTSGFMWSGMAYWTAP